MIRPLSLRRRVTVAFAAFGCVLSAMFMGATLFVTDSYEDILATEILSSQADDYSLRLANGLRATLPQTQRLSGYLAGTRDIPPPFARLLPGYYDDFFDDGTHVGVFDTSVGRLVFVIDLSDIEDLERLLAWFLAGVVVLGTALSGWLGWLFSGLALQPVRRLAASVDALGVQPVRTDLAGTTSHDDLGRLAHAIDAYQARLVEADTREQAFFADASHELRTPLAVIRGVTEVLLDDATLQASNGARLQRLDRGVRDMGQLLDALLGVARRTAPTAETLDAQAFLQDAAQIALAGRTDARVAIEAHGSFRAPHSEALLLVSGVLRTLMQQSPGGAWRLRLHGDELLIESLREEPDTAGQDASPRRSDTGHGDALFDRLAQRLDWRMAHDSASHVRLLLPDQALVRE